MDRSAVLAKTAKGLEEVKSRAHGLPQKQRTILIMVDGTATVGDILAKFGGIPEIAALHSTNGRWDLIAELRTDSLQAFDQVLNTVRLLDGISTTETSLLLGTYK